MRVCWLSYRYKEMRTKVPCTLGWPCTEGNWLYCDYFIWCVSCTVVVLTCSVTCGWVHVGEGGCFDNCVGVLVICVLLFTVFCIVCTVFLDCFVYVHIILICFVCTSVRTTAIEWKLNCSNNNNNNNNNSKHAHGTYTVRSPDTYPFAAVYPNGLTARRTPPSESSISDST